jgi:hypothetical protein
LHKSHSNNNTILYCTSIERIIGRKRYLFVEMMMQVIVQDKHQFTCWAGFLLQILDRISLQYTPNANERKTQTKRLYCTSIEPGSFVRFVYRAFVRLHFPYNSFVSFRSCIMRFSWRLFFCNWSILLVMTVGEVQCVIYLHDKRYRTNQI